MARGGCSIPRSAMSPRNSNCRRCGPSCGADSTGRRANNAAPRQTINRGGPIGPPFALYPGAANTPLTIAAAKIKNLIVWSNLWPRGESGGTMEFGITFKGFIEADRARYLVRAAEYAGFSYCWFY